MATAELHTPPAPEQVLILTLSLDEAQALRITLGRLEERTLDGIYNSIMDALYPAS